MRISNEALDELMHIYKEDFGEELTRSEASEVGFRLVTLYELLSQRFPNEKISVPKPLDEPPRSAGFLR